MKKTILMAAAMLAASMLLTACGGGNNGGLNLEPHPLTRERADGKIPVKTELIRAQVRAELAGVPEGEAKVLRWQQIETDYHACRLASDKAAKTEEKVFADCMANRGYVYMYRIDAEQLHNDIAFEMEKANREGRLEVQFPAAVANSPVVTTTVAISPPPVTIVAEDAESDSGGYAGYLLGLAAAGGIVAAVAGGGGGDDSSSGGNLPVVPPQMTMITPTIAPPTTPIRYEVTALELGAWHIEDIRQTTSLPLGSPRVDGSWLMIIPIAEQGGLSFELNGSNIHIQRQNVTRTEWTGRIDFPALVNRERWNALGRDGWHDIHSFTIGDVGVILGGSYLPNNNFLPARHPVGYGNWQVLFATDTGITRLSQLCNARWLGNYINANHRPNGIGGSARTICNYPGNTSYSPDMRRVVHAAMADTFRQGIGIGESNFAFSGNYNGDERAAGFSYDIGGFALRTDYARLPSKQDGEVWLDTYRFGALTRVNDEVQFFAGVDSYRNAIFAIDAKGDNMHRLGFAVGNGYAVKYEYQIRL
ncbi:MAG: hypothetical protein ACR2P4_08940 [Gammaproteobacteria bacterium]